MPEILLNEDGSMQEDGLVRLKLVKTISGRELIDCLSNGIDACIGNLKGQISCYDKSSLFNTWFHFVRLVEEFINIRYELGETYESLSKRIHFENECEMDLISSFVEETFGKEVLKNFQEIAYLFAGFGYTDVIDEIEVEQRIETIHDLLVYLQGRRLHIMTILNMIPEYAKGETLFSLTDVKTKMNEWIKGYLMIITLGCQAILEAKCLPDFYGEVTPLGIKFSHHYTHLEDMFLEPQRLTILDLEKYRSMRFEERKTKNNKSICSMEEYDIMLHNDALYYEKYGVQQNKIYQSLVAFMNEMKPFFIDDYLIEVQQKDFELLCQRHRELELYRELDDFYDLQNSRYGFVRMNDAYYSTFFMLIRFYVNYLNIIFRRNKTCQIDSGYIFEDKVKEAVSKYGFEVQDGCKRIDHKEFDVVCIKDGTIYNFQCKNNYMSVSSIGVKESDIASRYNRRLTRYYEDALKKERKREQLLKDKLEIDKIQHYVISRFPVVTDNKYIIPFNRLEDWLIGN